MAILTIFLDEGQAIGRRLIQVRGEFSTGETIAPTHLSFLEYDLYDSDKLNRICHQLMEEINRMTRLPALAPLKDA
jgi:hypothetical protein